MTDAKKEKAPRKMFTPQEDALIVMLVDKYGQKDWKLIAQSLPNRTTRQVRERFRNYLTPGLTNGPWSRQEDELLKNLYAQYGPKWSKISTFFKSRSDVNIKNRWTSISKVNYYVSSPETVPEMPQKEENKVILPEEPQNYTYYGFDEPQDLYCYDNSLTTDWGFGAFD